VTQGIRDAWEQDNPVGTTRFLTRKWTLMKMAVVKMVLYRREQNSAWQSRRLKRRRHGGSDTVTLQRANLPAVQIDVSGETSEQPEQKLTTRAAVFTTHGGVAGKG
jgi:hypothetical protein